MLRKRIIFALLFNNGVLFRTRQFKPNHRYTHNFIDTWSVDEIVMLDISRENNTDEGHESFQEILNKLASKCFVPISAGGKIRSLEDVKHLLDNGADKIILNTQAFNTPTFISDIALKYGSQCVVVSIDAKQINDTYYVYLNNGATATNMDILSWLKIVEKMGAGELLINSIDFDGLLTGYDEKLMKLVKNNTSLPVIACGGAGNWQHMSNVFKLGISGACTTNIFHFTEQSINNAKQFLANQKVPVREPPLPSYNYDNRLR